MLPHKEYLELKRLCEKHKIDSSNESLSKIAKVVEAFTEFQNPILHKRILNYRKIIQKRTMPNGKIAIDKNLLPNHIATVKRTLNEITRLMTSSQTKGNGALIAKQWSELNLSQQCIQLSMGVPIKDLANDLL